MKMLCRLVVMTVLCLGSAAATVIITNQGSTDDALNKYIDMVMKYLQILIVKHGLDPATLPKASVSFSKEIFGIKWHGDATAYDGWLRGLTNIHRTGNSEFIRDEKHIVTGLKTAVGLSDMRGHYKCLARFMDLGPRADVTIYVDGASMSLSGTLDRKACRFHITNINIDEIGDIVVNVHGLGLLDWILDLVVTMVANNIEVFLRDTIEDPLKKLINDALQKVDLTIIGPIIGCDPKLESVNNIVIPSKLETF